MVNNNDNLGSYYHDGYSMFDSEQQIDEVAERIAQTVCEKILADIK